MQLSQFLRKGIFTLPYKIDLTRYQASLESTRQKVAKSSLVKTVA